MVRDGWWWRKQKLYSRSLSTNMISDTWPDLQDRVGQKGHENIRQQAPEAWKYFAPDSFKYSTPESFQYFAPESRKTAHSSSSLSYSELISSPSVPGPPGDQNEVEYFYISQDNNAVSPFLARKVKVFFRYSKISKCSLPVPLLQLVEHASPSSSTSWAHRSTDHVREAAMRRTVTRTITMRMTMSDKQFPSLGTGLTDGQLYYLQLKAHLVPTWLLGGWQHWPPG